MVGGICEIFLAPQGNRVYKQVRDKVKMSIRVSDVVNLRVKTLYKALLCKADESISASISLVEKVADGRITASQAIEDLEGFRGSQRKVILDLGNDAIRDIASTLDTLGIEIILRQKE